MLLLLLLRPLSLSGSIVVVKLLSSSSKDVRLNPGLLPDNGWPASDGPGLLVNLVNFIDELRLLQRLFFKCWASELWLLEYQGPCSGLLYRWQPLSWSSDWPSTSEIIGPGVKVVTSVEVVAVSSVEIVVVSSVEVVVVSSVEIIIVSSESSSVVLFSDLNVRLNPWTRSRPSCTEGIDLGLELRLLFPGLQKLRTCDVVLKVKLGSLCWVRDKRGSEGNRFQRFLVDNGRSGTYPGHKCCHRELSWCWGCGLARGE